MNYKNLFGNAIKNMLTLSLIVRLIHKDHRNIFHNGNDVRMKSQKSNLRKAPRAPSSHLALTKLSLPQFFPLRNVKALECTAHHCGYDLLERCKPSLRKGIAAAWCAPLR